MGQMQRHSISILLILLLTACGPASARPALETQPPSPAELPSTRVLSGSDKLGGAAVVYERSGGFAGISETWNIYPDGRIVSPQGHEYTVPPERVSSLLSEIESLGFFEMSDTSGRFSACRDCFTYRITVNNDGQVRAVTAVDAATDTPAEFWQILERIRDLVASFEQDS